MVTLQMRIEWDDNQSRRWSDGQRDEMQQIYSKSIFQGPLPLSTASTVHGEQVSPGRYRDEGKGAHSHLDHSSDTKEKNNESASIRSATAASFQEATPFTS